MSNAHSTPKPIDPETAAELLAAASAVLGDLRSWVGCVARSNGFNHEKTRRTESRVAALRAAIAKATGGA